MAANFDAVFTRVTARCDDPRVGVGNAGEHVGLAHLPPDAGGDRVGERAGQRTQSTTGLGEQMQQSELGEHVAVPVG